MIKRQGRCSAECSSVALLIAAILINFHLQPAEGAEAHGGSPGKRRRKCSASLADKAERKKQDNTMNAMQQVLERSFPVHVNGNHCTTLHHAAPRCTALHHTALTALHCTTLYCSGRHPNTGSETARSSLKTCISSRATPAQCKRWHCSFSRCCA